MHGYCYCKNCRNEWAARNAYHIEDDYETPYKKGGRGSSKKRCKRNKIDGTHSFKKPVYVYRWKNVWENNEWVYKKVLMKEYVCEHCTKPQKYYFWSTY